MQRAYFIASVIAIFSLVFLFQLGCAQEEKSKPLSQDEMVALGKYIVHSSACDDCHTPKIFTDKGPVLDTTKLLSGFPQGASLPKVDMNMIGPDKWVMTEKHLGAWVGPWGISYASNLTPDKATGIGTMTEEMFIKTIRDGKYMGVSRPLLPPMPWEVYRNKTDQDLKAIYAYLMSLKPIHNEVPQPTPPDKIGELASQK
jgi:hypothetical protein